MDDEGLSSRDDWLLIGLEEAFLGRDRKPFCVPRLDNRVRRTPQNISGVCCAIHKNLDKVSRGFYEEDATHVLHYYSGPKEILMV